MTKYICETFKPITKGAFIDDIEVESATDAAHVFASRLARRAFGKNGHCRTLRMDSRTMDGQSFTFEAFIGTPSRERHERGATVGRNEWLYVSVA